MDKYRINLVLRLFKNNELTQGEALKEILDIFSVSKRFNSNSFFIGMAIGGIIGLISIAIQYN